MARIRTIKPSFFRSRTIDKLSYEQRLTFIGLWTHVDDEGRCEYDPELIKADLWPRSRSIEEVESDIQALTEVSLIDHYIVSEVSLLAIRGWREHQRINRPTPSKLPEPSPADICPLIVISTPSMSAPVPLTEGSLPEGKGREGKGKERAAPAAAQPPAPKPPDNGIHAGLVVGAWTEAFEANGAKPTVGMRGQVGRLAAELLTAGNDPTKVLAAAQAAGTKGYATIDRELGAMTGRGRLKAVGDEDWRRYSEQ